MYDIEDMVKLWTIFRETLVIAKLRNNRNEVLNRDFFTNCVAAGYMRDMLYSEASPIYTHFLLRMVREDVTRNGTFSTAFVGRNSVVDNDFVTWPVTSDEWRPTESGMRLITADKTGQTFRYFMELRNAAILNSLRVFKPGTELKFIKLPSYS